MGYDGRTNCSGHVCGYLFVLSYGLGGKNLEQVEVTGALEPQQKKLMYTLIALVVVLFSNSPIERYYSGMNLNDKVVLLTFGLLMFVPPFSILSWEDTIYFHMKLFFFSAEVFQSPLLSLTMF